MQSRTGLLEVTHEPNYLWNGHGVWQPEEGLELMYNRSMERLQPLSLFGPLT